MFCGSLSSDGKLAVSGGEDDVAYIWDGTTGEILFKCSGHTDSVIYAGFNHDDSYIATGDMSGNIKVWQLSSKQMIWEYEMGDAVVSNKIFSKILRDAYSLCIWLLNGISLSFS